MDKTKRKIFIILLGVIFSTCFAGICSSTAGRSEMNITSAAFKNNDYIPKKYTCQGEDVSPPLRVEGVPDGTKSLVLIVDDPDAPMGMWVHWVVYDIPLISEIGEGKIPGKQGKNDFGRKDYGGPCPPSGTHRYFFKLYSLDTRFGLPEGKTKKEIEAAMDGHILGKVELIGLYRKS